MQTKCFMVITNLQCARMNKLQIHNIANYILFASFEFYFDIVCSQFVGAPCKNSVKYIYIYIYLTQNKMNLFVLLGHGSESFAAFLNVVILPTTKNVAVITAAVITTHHESEIRFR